jgi:hypothetical protein
MRRRRVTLLVQIIGQKFFSSIVEERIPFIINIQNYHFWRLKIAIANPDFYFFLTRVTSLASRVVTTQVLNYYAKVPRCYFLPQRWGTTSQRHSARDLDTV